jgi:tyrosinase
LLPIRHSQGIEPFANTMEASEITVNAMYYDVYGLHNAGHYLIALASDPDYHLKIPPGVMADQAVSMRDPSFYPYHQYLDNLFEAYKSTLPPHQIVGVSEFLLYKRLLT